MSLFDRAKKKAELLKNENALSCRTALRKLIDSNCEIALEVVDIVEDWAKGGDIALSYPTVHEFAGFLADDEVVGKYGSKTTFQKWLRDAKEGNFPFNEARQAIKSRAKQIKTVASTTKKQPQSKGSAKISRAIEAGTARSRSNVRGK